MILKISFIIPSAKGVGKMITVKEIFNLPQMENLVIRAGKEGLDRPIRWVHVIDHEDVGDFLEGGELLLACGQVWPEKESTVDQLLHSFLKKEIAGIIFATGRYLQECPKQVLDFGNKHGIPILEVPFEVSFVKVTRAIHEAILNKQYRSMLRTEPIPHELIEKMKTADTMTDICRIVSAHLGCYVIVTDPQNRVLVKMAPTGIKHISELTVIAKLRETVEMQVYSELNESHVLFEPNQAIYLPSRKPPFVLFVPIQVRSCTYYTLWFFDPYRPFNQTDEMIAEYVASLILDSILKEHEAKEELTKRRREFFQLLLNKPADYAKTVENMAAEFDLSPDHRFILGLVRFGYSVNIDNKLSWRDACQQWIDETPGVSGLCELYGQDVLTLLTFSEWRTYDQQLLNLYHDKQGVLPGCAPILMVSRLNPGLLSIADAYKETKLLSLIVQARNGLDPIYFAEHYRRELLLYGSLEQKKADHLRRLILPRELLEESGQGSLYETLKALALNEYNREQTAKELHIHRNTLRYRINRIEQLLGESLSSRSIQFWIQVAFDLESIAQNVD
jgi:sugar diacid utilization regulator